MNTTPLTNDLICYQTLPKWDFASIPKAFQNKHNTKVGTWAKLSITAGQLKYYALDADGNVLDTFIFDKDSTIPFIEPQAWHKIEALTEDIECQLAFYCQPQDYYQKKYKLSPVHSEVLGLADYGLYDLANKDNDGANYLSAIDNRASSTKDNATANRTVLDFGCGSGRNSLYLQQQGYEVTALDKNDRAIANIRQIILNESLTDINADLIDLNQLHLPENRQKIAQNEYDLVVSTVVLMFLQPTQVPTVIKTMQKHTKVGGYNLVVCAMDTQSLPFAEHELSFTFGFKENELMDYYQGWKIHKYNENIGHLHRLDKRGNPIALHFATLVAQKL